MSVASCGNGSRRSTSKTGVFAKACPEVVLDVVTLNEPADVIAGQFDAGIHVGEYIQHDMIAVRVSKDLRAAAVGSTEYFKSHDFLRERVI